MLPPLRDRREDIPLLTDFFFKRFSRFRGIELPDISPAVRYAFSRYRPGNVRELENACGGSCDLQLRHGPDRLRRGRHPVRCR